MCTKFCEGAETIFNDYYIGIFQKSFTALSNILFEAKFFVDLSVLNQNGRN